MYIWLETEEKVENLRMQYAFHNFQMNLQPSLLAKNAGYGSIKNVTLHLNSKITLQVFVNHVKINCMTI